MSEHVTHLAVAEDSARIACADQHFNPLMRDCIDEFPNALRQGSMTRSGDMFIFPLLEKWKAQWNDNPIQREKMAYVLGWACHLAADRTFKPVYRITDLAFYTRGYPGPSHSSIYHDAVTLHEVYHDGKDYPFHPEVVSHNLMGHPAAKALPVKRIEETFAYAYANDLASLKKFLTDEMTEKKSFEDTCDDDRQKFYVDVTRYSDAFYQPDPARLRQYIIKPNFYNRKDPVIVYARAIQNDGEAEINWNSIWNDIDQQSLYAQSLKLGYDFLLACSDYFSDKISLEQARINMKTNQPHTQPLDYYVKLVNSTEE